MFKHKVLELLEKIMSSFSDFATKQTAFNTAVASDLTTIKDSITAQNALIAQLQASQGTVTPADQALIDQLEANGATLQAQADALAGKTPPTPPAGP